jgi:hypothetical protein
MQTGLKNNERTSVSERGGELRVLKIEMGRWDSQILREIMCIVIPRKLDNECSYDVGHSNIIWKIYSTEGGRIHRCGIEYGMQNGWKQPPVSERQTSVRKFWELKLSVYSVK